MADAERKLTITPQMKDRASKGLERLGLVGKSAGNSIAAGFIKAQLALGAMKQVVRGVISGIRSITTDAAEQGDQFAKMSRRLGLAVETLSAFDHVAQLGGTSLESLGNALKLLQKNAYDASRGTGEAKDTFAELGINVKGADGHLKDAESLFYDVADALAGMTNESERSAAAQKILGRSGGELIPVMEQGSAAIRAQAKEAREFGSVWTTANARLAEGFQDARLRISKAIEGVRNAVAVELFPALTAGLNRIARYISENRDAIVDKAVAIFKAVSRFTINALADVIDVIGKIKEIVGSLSNFRASDVLALPYKFGEALGNEIADKFYGASDVAGSAGKTAGEKFRDAALPYIEELGNRAADALGGGGGDVNEPPVQRLPEVVVKGRRMGFLEQAQFGAASTIEQMLGDFKQVDTGKVDEAGHKIVKTFFEVRSLAKDVGATLAGTAAQGFTRFFDAIATGSATAREAFRSMAADIGRSLTQLAANRLFAELFGALLGSTGTGHILGGSVPVTAAGGVVFGAQARIVGEQGPEAIVPLSKWDQHRGGGNGDIYVTVNAPSNVDANAVKALAKQGVMEATQDHSFRKFMRGRLRGL